MRAWEAFKARPSVPRIRRFYEGGFQHAMTRREAALILGVRYILSFLEFSGLLASTSDNWNKPFCIFVFLALVLDQSSRSKFTNWMRSQTITFGIKY